VEGNECGICADPLNPEKIAGAIKYLVKHPKEAGLMGKKDERQWRINIVGKYKARNYLNCTKGL